LPKTPGSSREKSLRAKTNPNVTPSSPTTLPSKKTTTAPFPLILCPKSTQKYSFYDLIAFFRGFSAA
jgi:hypothetical protein